MIKAVLLTCLLAAVIAQENQEGHYVLNYEGDDHSHIQRGSAGHAVTGFYSYRDVSGKIHRVHYVADEKGYRVIGSSGATETKAANNAPVTSYAAPKAVAVPTEPVANPKIVEDAAVQVPNENPSPTPSSPTAAVVDVKAPEEDPPSIQEVADAKTVDVALSERAPVTDGKTAVPPLVYYLVAGLPITHPSAEVKQSAEDKKTDKLPVVYYIVPGPPDARPVNAPTTEKRNEQEKNPLVPVPSLRNSPYGYPFALPFGYPFYG